MPPARKTFQHTQFARDAFDVEFWDDETDPAETWATKPKQAEIWTQKTKQSETWTPKVVAD
jgi:hypothetical protein